MAAIPTPQNFSAPAVQGDVNAAKDATLRALAAGGSAAAERVATAQQYAQQAGGVNSAAFASILGQSGASQQNFYNSVGGNTSQYASQVSQAIPLEQEVTQQQLNSLGAVAQEREAQRAQQMALGNLSLQEAQLRLKQAQAADDPNSIAGQTALANLQRIKMGNYEAAHPAPSASDLNQNALNQLLGGVDGGPNSQAAQALAAALSGAGATDEGAGMTVLHKLVSPGTDAKGKATAPMYQTPGKKALDEAYLQDQLRRYYALRQQLAGQSTVPSPNAFALPAGVAGPVLG